MVDLSSVMAKLASERQIFHSEADFQHAFAWEVHSRFPATVIRLEHPFPVAEKVLHLDFWAARGGEALAVELKYKTRGLTSVVKGEKYPLANHSAQDCGRYDFLKDIQRLEQIASNTSNVFGYAILLTNDSSYWSELNSAQTVDADFRLPRGRGVNGTLKWGNKASRGTVRGRENPLTLPGHYVLQWSEFSALDTERYGRFRYLAVAIPHSR